MPSKLMQQPPRLHAMADGGRPYWSIMHKTDPKWVRHEGEIYASLCLRTHGRPVRRLPREDFALNLSIKRCLCNTVGGRFIEGASRCCAISTARSRAVATTNLARSNHSLLLRALFGGTKGSTLVNIFMICPPMAGW
jgi:hypothetical protein